MSEDSLKNRILNALNCFPNHTLLEDDMSSWTGAQLCEYLPRVVNEIDQSTLIHSRVGICFDNSSVQAIAILATLLAGRVPVMINSVDLLEARLDWIHHAKLTYVIVSEDLADRVQVPRLVMNSKGGMISVAPPQAVRGSNGAGFLPPLGTGVILFTSGSTGEPKEIYIPETGILRTIDNLKKTFSLNDETVASVTLPMCHSMALNTQFFPAFLVGGKSRFYNLRLQINKVFRGFLRDQSTFVALIGEIVRTAWEERRRKGLPACESVAHVQLAGGLITPFHLEMTRELFPNALIHKGYGLTEAIRVTMISSENPLFAGTAVGQPLPFLELQIRSETGDVLSAGQFGEVYVRGESVMLGMRSLSSDHIRLTKASDFLPTGDLGMLDQNGYLHVSGRLDSLFKINGRRVSGVEIEKVALDSDEHFRFAKAILVDDEDRCRSRIILFVELDRSSWQNGMLHLAPEIQERLAERMRQLSVPPREIVFIKQIPRTSNGKLNLPQLKRIWLLRSMRPIEKVTHLNFKLFSVDEEVWV